MGAKKRRSTLSATRGRARVGLPFEWLRALRCRLRPLLTWCRALPPLGSQRRHWGVQGFSCALAGYAVHARGSLVVDSPERGG